MAQTDWFDQQQTQQLSAGFPERMVLLDCETTGGRSSFHRIIELGLVVIERGIKVDYWQTFINPERSIPAGITRLTGITPNMVSEAPTFGEIKDQLLSYLQDRTLVAHHARFDYGFLKMEFERAGVSFSTKPLCSVKFSRLLYPNYKRHGLDHIIRRFHININNRHRALDDAMAIYAFFLKSSAILNDQDIEDSCQQLLKEHTLPVKINRHQIDALPRSTGVYYFYDEQDRLLYVGKSVNIRQRVLSHFSQDYKNHKDLKMSASISHVDHQSTTTDFGAQILESQQVKALKPLYNSRLKRVRKLYRIKTTQHADGYLFPLLKTIDVSDSDHLVQDHYGLFRSRRMAHKKLQYLADEFQLCHRLLGLESAVTGKNTPCFRYQLKKCAGVCCGDESYAEHNQRLLQALDRYHQKVWPWSDAILIEERNETHEPQQTFHLVNQWIYLGKITDEADLYERGYQLNPGPVDQVERTDDDLEFAEDFDLDIYFILVRFLLDPDKLAVNNIKIHPLRSVLT